MKLLRESGTVLPIQTVNLTRRCRTRFFNRTRFRSWILEAFRGLDDFGGVSGGVGRSLHYYRGGGDHFNRQELALVAPDSTSLLQRRPAFYSRFFLASLVSCFVTLCWPQPRRFRPSLSTASTHQLAEQGVGQYHLKVVTRTFLAEEIMHALQYTQFDSVRLNLLLFSYQRFRVGLSAAVVASHSQAAPKYHAVVPAERFRHATRRLPERAGYSLTRRPSSTPATHPNAAPLDLRGNPQCGPLRRLL